MKQKNKDMRNAFSILSLLIGMIIVGSMSYVAYKAISSSANESSAYTNVRNDLNNIVKAEYQTYSENMFFIPFGDDDNNTEIKITPSGKFYQKNIKVNDINASIRVIVSKDEDKINVKLIQCKDNQQKPIGFLAELHNKMLNKNFYYDSCKGAVHKTSSNLSNIEKHYKIVTDISDVLPINNILDDIEGTPTLNNYTGDQSEENVTEFTNNDICKYPLKTEVGLNNFKKHFMHKSFIYHININGNEVAIKFNIDAKNGKICISNATFNHHIKNAIQDNNKTVLDINTISNDFMNYFQIPASDDFSDNVEKMKSSIETLKAIFDDSGLKYSYNHYSNYDAIKTNNKNFYLFEYASDRPSDKSVYFQFNRKYSWLDNKKCSKNFKIDNDNIGEYWWQWKKPGENISFDYNSNKGCDISITFQVKDDIDNDGIRDIWTGVTYVKNSDTECLNDNKFTYDSFKNYLTNQINKSESYVYSKLYENAYKSKIWNLYTCRKGWRVCNSISDFINKISMADSISKEDNVYQEFKNDYSNNPNILSEIDNVYNKFKFLREKAKNKAEELINDLETNINEQCNPLTTWDKFDYDKLDIKEQNVDDLDSIYSKFEVCGSNAIDFIRNNICNKNNNMPTFYGFHHKCHFKINNLIEFDMNVSDADLWFIPNKDIRNKILQSIDKGTMTVSF